MPETVSVEEYKTCFIEVLKKDRKRSFYLHFSIYIVVNLVSAMINFLFTPQFPWIIFPVFFWGLGVIWNFVSAFILIDHKMEELALKAENLLRK